jgi:mRNA interferase MazF
MKVHRGEIALAFFPFSSGVGGKKRPVLIVQNDRDNQRRSDTIVVQITSNLRRSGEPTTLLIKVSTPEGRASGLLQDSLVACGNIATIESDLIDRVVGQLSPEEMEKVEECLRVVLGL